MNISDFNNVVQTQVNRSLGTLVQKGVEYGSDVDRLHAFKQAAHLQNITNKEALGGMMVKHTTSIYDMINSGETYSEEMWDEKIGDHINYLLLLRALVAEELLESSLKKLNHMVDSSDKLASLPPHYKPRSEGAEQNIKDPGN